MAGNVDGHTVRAVNTMGEKVRFQVVVPVDDETTLRWIAAQNSLSVSLRLVAKYLTAKVGAVDFLSAFDFDSLAQEGSPAMFVSVPETAEVETVAVPEEAIDAARTVVDVPDEAASELVAEVGVRPEPAPAPEQAPSLAPSADDAASRLQRMMGGI